MHFASRACPCAFCHLCISQHVLLAQLNWSMHPLCADRKNEANMQALLRQAEMSEHKYHWEIAAGVFRDLKTEVKVGGSRAAACVSGM